MTVRELINYLEDKNQNETEIVLTNKRRNVFDDTWISDDEIEEHHLNCGVVNFSFQEDEDHERFDRKRYTIYIEVE